MIVYEVGAPYGPLSTEEFEDYEIEHTPECGFDSEYDDMDEGRYVCGVEYNAEACGVRWSLHYTGTTITEPGEYAIQAWSAVYRGFDYTEYDGGIAVVPEDDEPLAAGRSDAATSTQEQHTGER